jgi:hypothetical protein
VGSSAPPLLPLLRSQVQGSLLALLFLHPEQEYSLTDTARLIGASVKSVHQEAARLAEGGIIAQRRMGNLRLIRADLSTVLAGPLTDLLVVTYGPVPVLTDLLSQVPEIGEALIFGSWAARHAGEPGPLPVDVDLLVIGHADLDALDEVAAEAGRILHRPVNIQRVRPARWMDTVRRDPFLESVRTRPTVRLDLVSGHDGKQTS